MLENLNSDSSYLKGIIKSSNSFVADTDYKKTGEHEGKEVAFT